MKVVGGYVMVNLNGIEIAATSGSSTPVTVPAEVVAKLKQYDKPVYLEHFSFTIDGGNAELSGFTAHSVMAGVHTHYCGIIQIAVSGDTQITVTPN